MSKGNFTKGTDGSLVYTTVAKPGSAPSLDSSKWYVDKCEIAGYGPEHLTIKVSADGIIRVDGNFKDEKASRSFFKEYIIPDGVDHEAIEFGIYEADKNTLVIMGAISAAGGAETAPALAPVPAAPAPPPPTPVAQQQQQATTTETSSKIVRTESERVTSTFTETFESSELEGSEDISKEIRVADKKFETKLNVSEYKTEEVHVKISRKIVLVYTSRKETTTTTTSSTHKEIKKRFEIPAGVKPESITSVIEKDGNLTISAPVDEGLAKQQASTTTTNQQQVTEQQQQQKVTEQQQQVTTSNEVAVQQQQQQVQQTITNADEVVLRTRTVNTVKNVTGKDLQGVKIVKDRFEMNVDVREYSQQEVTIKIVKTRRVVTVSASHKSQFESRSLFKEFTLPAGAPDSNPDAVDAVLSSNGILTISGPCAPLPAALTDITNAMVRSTQDSQVQQQQSQQVVQQEQTQTQTSQTQQIQQQQEEQHQHQTVQKSSYTKITRKTFTSSTMTSLDVTGTEDGSEPPQEPGTPVEDVSEEMVEDEDGNLIVELNVKDYKAEDIKVRVSKTTITVSGRKTEEIREENKVITRVRQFCKKIRIPAGVTVTPQSITSNLDTAEGVLVIMIVRSKTTTTKQVTQQQPQPQQQIESVQQQQRQQEQTSVQETQTQTRHQQQVESVQQEQQKQVESQQSVQGVESVQKTSQQTTESVLQQQLQQKNESVQQTNQQQQTESVQKEQVQQLQQNVNQQQQLQQNVDQQRQVQQQIDNTQKSTSTVTTTSTSKRTIRTTITSTDALQKLGYNFDSATTQVYTGDPKFFERATPIVDYKPEELDVKIAFPWVIVEGKQEMSAENGWRSKQFTKMFTVPQGVKPENIKLELNDAGDVVHCTAPIG